MKIITAFSDFNFPVKISGPDNLPIPLTDISTFTFDVFTTDIDTSLNYDKSDVDLSTGQIYIDGQDASILENGVVYYKYYYSVPNEDFEDGSQDITKIAQTDVYLKNYPETHKPTCATSVSELVNDVGYVTWTKIGDTVQESIDQRLGTYATKAYVDASITAVKNQIPVMTPYATKQWVEDKHYVSGDILIGRIDASVILMTEETYQNIKDTSVFDASALYLTYEV